jgi:ABC-2 type transport system ATP-binding protein
LSAETIDVTFAGEAPELAPLDSIKVEHSGANTLRCTVSGNIAPLLAALSDGKHEVVALHSREPSLEEIFLHYYGQSDDGNR